MPVNLLYCEGESKSPDIRLLSALLAGLCVIEPAGSKYGLGQKVRLARNIRTGSVVAGLRDRDFDEHYDPPLQAPRPWRVENNTLWLGWYWERKEIENYLIDPVVVAKALQNKAPEASAYTTALLSSAEIIADYTAARTAVTACRVRFSPLENVWGRKRGSDHIFPDGLQEADCRSAIIEITRQYTQHQAIQADTVLAKFDLLLSFCRPGGQRFQNYLACFAGKDLMVGMQDALIGFGLGAPREFRERILKGIENASDDVWTWLPEWQALRNQVANIISNEG